MLDFGLWTFVFFAYIMRHFAAQKLATGLFNKESKKSSSTQFQRVGFAFIFCH
jgi:hypothetical protein